MLVIVEKYPRGISGTSKRQRLGIRRLTLGTSKFKEDSADQARRNLLDGRLGNELRHGQIKTKLDAVYGNPSPSMTIVRYWFNEFKRGRSYVFNEERPGRLADVVTEEIVEKVHDMILADRRTKVREVAEAIGVSYGTAFNILHDNLGMKKLSARWMPRLLTVDNKRMRLSISKQCLELFKRNPKEFLRRVVTVDETWIHYYAPETKVQSKQWISPGERVPKKAKMVLSAGKVMVFWNAQGVIFIDYEGKQNYHGTDNAPAHSSVVATAKLVELRYELLSHPPYSPDLALCDFFLFPNLKKWLGGKRFTSNEEVIAETEVYFCRVRQIVFFGGVKKMAETLGKVYPPKKGLR
ncbi:histone-lysine N-methyltransferase SETMAR-like [Mycetomoellerius zeteki]|uniref:histone-lysine N-methyltransferase SETMAR-like n=1 Tax=Mycetomoellerius zeteki TaxID=64791 RepID=UPI00084EBC81|nr:PREDICTED: histone-lysine N-methyltransferase SETMAR-like [Trachymyrmex zeteki]